MKTKRIFSLTIAIVSFLPTACTVSEPDPTIVDPENYTMWFTLSTLLRVNTHVMGGSWEVVTPSPELTVSQSYGALVFQNKIWVVGGADASAVNNKVFFTSDGTTWGEGAFLGVSGAALRGVGGNSTMYVASFSTLYNANAATYNGTWASNALPANQVKPPVLLIFNGKLWIIGGTSIYTTTNHGGAYTTVTSNSGLPAVSSNIAAEMSGAVFAGKMWIFTQSNTTSTVYSSADGITWTSSGTIPYGTLDGGVINSTLYAINGYSSFTVDGTSWTTIGSPVAGSLTSPGGRAVVFGQRLWIGTGAGNQRVKFFRSTLTGTATNGAGMTDGSF